MSSLVIRIIMIISWTSVFVLGIPLLIWQMKLFRQIQSRANNDKSNRQHRNAFSLTVDILLVNNSVLFKSLSAEKQCSCRRWRVAFICYVGAFIIGLVTYYAYTFGH
jgi:hypothetical protein